MNFFSRFVVPAAVALGVMYPASFLMGMWRSAENGDLAGQGALVAGGDLRNGWRYEIYERRFPKLYRMDMASGDHGFGTLCVIEVRDGPKPVAASAGDGTLVYVTLDEPLPGHTGSRIAVDLAEALNARCAAVVADGHLFAGGAASLRGGAAPGADSVAATELAPSLAASDGDDRRIASANPMGL